MSHGSSRAARRYVIRTANSDHLWYSSFVGVSFPAFMVRLIYTAWDTVHMAFLEGEMRAAELRCGFDRLSPGDLLQ